MTKKIGMIGKYKIILSDHAKLRTKQRNIDTMQVISAILSFGIDKLNEYEKRNTDIMIQDKQNNFSVVFAVNTKAITIITVINKGDCYIKNNTIIEEIGD